MNLAEEIEVRHGRVTVGGERLAELSPEEADRLARLITIAAETARKQAEEMAEACADGHELGQWRHWLVDGWARLHSVSAEEVRHCLRPGCEYREVRGNRHATTEEDR